MRRSRDQPSFSSLAVPPPLQRHLAEGAVAVAIATRAWPGRWHHKASACAGAGSRGVAGGGNHAGTAVGAADTALRFEV